MNKGHRSLTQLNHSLKALGLGSPFQCLTEVTFQAKLFPHGRKFFTPSWSPEGMGPGQARISKEASTGLCPTRPSAACTLSVF